MKLSDYTRARQPQLARVGEEDLGAQVRTALNERVDSERIGALAGLEPRRAREELTALATQAMNLGGFEGWTHAQRQEGIDEAADMILGLGPLEALLNDDTITEVMVNGPEQVFYERDGRLHPSGERFASERELRMVVDRIVAPLGRRVDEQSPLVSARLPQGHRVNVVIPPIALEGTAVTIRKFRRESYSLDDLVALGTLTEDVAQLLRWAVRARKNIAVSGGTGGGKTTLLNALSREIPAEERVITIEDAAELRFDAHPHVVRLEARAANAEGRGAVTIRELVVNALRMRPDRIVVGECRGAEALDMLQAMSTGHDGSLTTLHANSPAEVPVRLVMMVRYGVDLPAQLIEMQVASALDLIVQIDRTRGGRRQVTQVVAKRAQPGAAEPFGPVATWDRSCGAYRWEQAPAWVEELADAGIATEEEVRSWACSVRSCS